MQMNHVVGQKRGRIVLYALSTCVWCRKTKQLLNHLGVEYKYVDVDLLGEEERKEVTAIVRELNPRCSYPTLTVGDVCIVGYDEEKIQEALGR